MEVRVLGPLEVVAGGVSIPIGGGRQRKLLAILLLHANEFVSSDRLIDDLWGEDRPGTAAKALQGYVSQLRKTLGPEMLVTGAGGYMFKLAPGQLDAERFEQLVDDARDAEPHDAAEWLREALALWRGPPLADFTYDDFAQGEIARLEERRLVALERRIEADLALGRHAEVAGELASLVRQHPLRERLRAELMLALYRSGRQAEALEAFADARRTLREELGLSLGQVGVVIAAGWVGATVTLLPWGLAADRYGERFVRSSGWSRAKSCGSCRPRSSCRIHSSAHHREPPGRAHGAWSAGHGS